MAAYNMPPGPNLVEHHSLEQHHGLEVHGLQEMKPPGLQAVQAVQAVQQSVHGMSGIPGGMQTAMTGGSIPNGMQGPMQSSLQNSLQDSMQNVIQNSMQGSMQGAMQNGMQGGMPQGRMQQGALSGSMQPELRQNSQSGEGLQGMEDSNLSEGVPQEYDQSLALQSVGSEDGHLDEHEDQQQNLYGTLGIHDILPIEAARVRFLHLLVDHFVTYHIVPVQDQPPLKHNEKIKKRKLKEMNSKAAYEGDPRYLLPLIYVANMYETLVGEINARMSETEGLQGKSMGLALEAAGGLYRRLVEKYPKSGNVTSFKRREMASALEARAKFPSLVTGDEKRVRFIVVHGLELLERPTTMCPEDAEWFRRITGRHEVEIYPRDYKFYSARTKTRRPASATSLQMSHMLPPGMSVSSAHQHTQHHQGPHTHQQHGPMATTHVGRPVMQSPGHLAALMISQASGPAKFCDECGTPFSRDSSKFCSECGMKRPGV